MKMDISPFILKASAIQLPAICIITVCVAVVLNVWKARLRFPRKISLMRKHASGNNTHEKEENFKMPVPPPYPNWSLATTKPLPYRAFRYGPKYQVTMGLRSVSPIEWIELDNQFPKYHSDKAARLSERGDQCVKTHPDAFPAAVELLEELVAYLPARYPSLYERSATGIKNLWSGETFNVKARPLEEDPMAICARLLQDDIALMVEQPDGQYRLLAGAILLAGFWRLSDKFGMTLSNIHTSGDVPHFREKLESGMVKFFQRLKCDAVYARNNYFIQVDESLPWSHSIGSEDSSSIGWSTAEKDKAIENHWFRSERQTLRRLPKTRAICFTIRTYFHPVTDIVKEKHVPGRLASAIRSWDSWVAEYKGRERYGEVLLEYLDRKHEEQLQSGLGCPEDENTGSYPW